MNSQKEQELRSLLTQAVQVWQSVRDETDPDALDAWVESSAERSCIWAAVLDVEAVFKL